MMGVHLTLEAAVESLLETDTALPATLATLAIPLTQTQTLTAALKKYLSAKR